MSIDYSKFSDADLEAIVSADYSKMSESALRIIAGIDPVSQITPEESDYKLKSREQRTTTEEDIRGAGMTAFSPIQSAVLGADLLATKGLASLGLPGAEEEAEKSYARFRKAQEDRKTKNPVYGRKQGAGELWNIPATIPTLLNPIVAGAYGVGTAFERGQQSLDQGATVDQAQMESMVSGGLTAANRALPASIGMGAKAGAVTGAVINTATTPLEPAAINFLREDYPNKMPQEYVPDPFNDPYTYVGGAATGATFGAIQGARNKQVETTRRLLDPTAEDLQNEGDSRKLDRKNKVTPTADQINAEVEARQQAELRRKNKVFEKNEKLIQEIEKDIDRLNKSTYDSEETAAKAATMIKRREEDVARLKEQNQTIKDEITPPAKEAREPGLPYSKTPLGEVTTEPGKRFDINEQITPDWAKQQSDETLNAAMDRKLTLLEQLRSKDPEKKNDLRDVLLPNEIRLIQAEIDSRSGTSVVKKTKQQDPFREAGDIYNLRGPEALDAFSKERMASEEAQPILRERQKIVEKENKTIDDFIQMARLDDQYNLILIKHNPQDNLRAYKDTLLEELRDLSDNPSDAYSQIRIPEVKEMLSKLDAFERRATSKKESDPLAKIEQLTNYLAEPPEDFDVKSAVKIRLWVDEQLRTSKDEDVRAALYPLRDLADDILSNEGAVTANYHNKTGYIDTLDVTPELQGSGLGKLKVKTIEEDLRRNKVKTAFVQAKPESVGFWEKQGFVRDPSFVEEAGENIPMSKSLTPTLTELNNTAVKSMGKFDPELTKAIPNKHLSGNEYELAARSALEIIANDTAKYGESLSRLARNLLDNPAFNPQMRFLWEKSFHVINSMGKKLEAMGAYHGKENLIRMSEKGMNAVLIMHEFAHAASSQVLTLVHRFAKGNSRSQLLSGLSKREINAALKLGKLYEYAIKSKAIPSAEVAARVSEHATKRQGNLYNIADMHEFISYGLTDPNIIDRLKATKYGSTNMLDKFLITMREFFGKSRTVYDELLDLHKKLAAENKNRTWDQQKKAMSIEGQKLFQSMEKRAETNPSVLSGDPNQGPPPPQQINGVWISSNDTKRLDHADKLNAVIDDTIKGSDVSKNTFSSNYFGFQQYRSIQDSHPLVDHTLKAISSALNTKAQLLRNWVGGTVPNAARRVQKHAVFTLEHVKNGLAPLMILSATKDKDVAAVRQRMVDNLNNQRKHTDNLEGLTPTQVRLVESLQKLFDKMHEDVNVDRKNRGMPLIPYRDGWIPSIRTGDFGVFVKGKDGEIVHFERFRSEHEARMFIKNVPKEFDPGQIVDIKDMNVPPDMVQQMRQMFAEEFEVTDQLATKEFGQTLYGQKTSHDKLRSGISGYLGSRWNRTEAQNVRDFKDAITKGIDEFANSHKRAIVQHETSYIMNKLSQMGERERSNFVNAEANAELLIKSALGGHDKSATVDRWIRTTIDDNISKLVNSIGKNNDWYPRVPIADRTHGLAAQMFYLSALTTRPGFWFAQLLSTPQAFRHIFREDTGLSGMATMGKGLMTAFSGGDRAFKDAVFWVANNRDTFHPQFINEINQLPAILGGGKLNTLSEWITGQKISAGADSLSRYMTFAVMYEHYKKQGFSGKELYRRASEATEETMVMYNMPYKSPFIQNMGMAGQMISPLMTFATAQQGLLLADAKTAIRDKNIKPLVATTLTAAAMGGAVGLPLMFEYELLAEWLGLPSFKEFLLARDNRKEKVLGMDAQTVMFGGPTAAVNAGAQKMGMSEGWDIGSGLRWNNILSKQLTADASIIDLLPAVSFAAKAAAATKVVLKDLAGEPVPENELLQAKKTLSILVGQKYIYELSAEYEKRKMNAQGKASKASKETTDADRVSSLLGTQSLSARKESIRQEKLFFSKTQAKKTVEEQSIIAAEALLKGDQETATKAIQEIIKADPSVDPNTKIQKIIKDRNIPQWMRDVQSKNPNIINQRMELGQ